MGFTKGEGHESGSSDHRHWRRVFRARRFSDDNNTFTSSFLRGMGGGVIVTVVYIETML